jgi:hypothetical protein
VLCGRTQCELERSLPFAALWRPARCVQAVAAISTLNGTELGGRNILVREDREDRDVKQYNEQNGLEPAPRAPRPPRRAPAPGGRGGRGGRGPAPEGGEGQSSGTQVRGCACGGIRCGMMRLAGGMLVHWAGILAGCGSPR